MQKSKWLIWPKSQTNDTIQWNVLQHTLYVNARELWKNIYSINFYGTYAREHLSAPCLFQVFCSGRILCNFPQHLFSNFGGFLYINAKQWSVLKNTDLEALYLTVVQNTVQTHMQLKLLPSSEATTFSTFSRSRSAWFATALPLFVLRRTLKALFIFLKDLLLIVERSKWRATPKRIFKKKKGERSRWLQNQKELLWELMNREDWCSFFLYFLPKSFGLRSYLDFYRHKGNNFPPFCGSPNRIPKCCSWEVRDPQK